MTGSVKTGWVKIVGLGPGDEALVTPEVRAVVDDATDVVSRCMKATTGSRSNAPVTRSKWPPRAAASRW